MKYEINPIAFTRKLASAAAIIAGALLATSCSQTEQSETETLPQATATGLALGAGVNISHWLSQRGDHTPASPDFFTQDDVAFLAAQGFNHIRLPIEESIMWDGNGNRNPVAFEMLDDALAWIHDAGLTAIVDLHIVNSHHFNASNDGGSNTLFSDPASQDHLVALWADLSSFLNKWDNDFLAYEILNEAVADDNEDWNKLLAKCIPALRDLEPERPIVIGSNRWQQAGTLPFLKIPAGDPNLVLSFHFYSPFPFTHYRASWSGPYSAYEGPINYPGQLIDPAYLDTLPDGPIKDMLADNIGPNDRASLLAEMQPAIDYAKAHNLPLYCGEWGSLKTVNRDDMLAWYADMSSILREQGIQFAIWDYKGGFNIVDPQTGTPDLELIKTILGN